MSQTSRYFRPPLLILTGTLILALALAACTTKTRPSEESDWEVRVESPLDSLDVPAGDASDPAVVIAEEGTAVPEAVAEDRPVVSEPVAVPDPRDFAPGWRVQIAALSSMATAEEVAEGARDRFQETVYVEYEPPLYKVRVGDFLVREEAESMKTRAHAQEYTKAWVVETLVLKPSR